MYHAALFFLIEQFFTQKWLSKSHYMTVNDDFKQILASVQSYFGEEGNSPKGSSRKLNFVVKDCGCLI